MVNSNEETYIETKPIFDPIVYANILHIGLSFFAKKEVRDYNEWLLKMNNDFEEHNLKEVLQPYINSVWTTMREWLYSVHSAVFNKKVVTDFCWKISTLLRTRMATTFREVIGFLFDIQNNDEDKRFIYRNQDLIRFLHLGIKKFFEENQIPKTESHEERTPTMSRTAKTNTKSSKKKTSDKKVDAREESAGTPSPVKVTYYKRMGIVELSNNNAVSIALLRNALDQKFIAIERVYKAKDGEYKVKNKLWLPFKEMGDIGDVIAHAYNEGVKAGWLNTYEPQPMILPQENVPTKSQEKPALRELVLVSKDASLYQTTLFDDEEKK